MKQNIPYQAIYLIQHRENGYVHCAFATLNAARAWMQLYPFNNYAIIEREMYQTTDDMGKYTAGADDEGQEA